METIIGVLILVYTDFMHLQATSLQSPVSSVGSGVSFPTGQPVETQYGCNTGMLLLMHVL